MHQEQVFHDSHQLYFRNPFGAVACREKITLRLEVRLAHLPESVILRLWKNNYEEEKIHMYLNQQRGETRIYETTVVAPKEEGLLWYYFIVKGAGKTYYYGNNTRSLGGSGQVFDHIPPAYQITVYHEEAKTPSWFKEAVMYQIFVDRFANGCEDGTILDPKKDSLIHAHWDSTPIYIRDVRQGKVIRWDFFGGNLLGIIKKLPYLKELGINVIYLNPIFAAPSNHKYDTADYKKIDEMFGDNEIFANLCAIAKEMGMSIILDGVFSHTGSDSIYFNKEGNYPQLGAFQSVNSPYYSWYRFSEYPHEYESWWGIETLPNINEMDPSYQEFIIHHQDSVIKYWMKLGAKGWRLDVADELPGEFVKMVRQAMKEKDPDSILIGEVWEDASNKISHGEQREYLLGKELDSVMNYPFRAALVDFVLGYQTAEETQAVLMSLYENYPLEHFYGAMNLIGSHDIRRILTLLGEAPHGDTLTVEEMSVFRLPPEQKQLAIARLKLLTLIQLTFPGVPCIYYGDEAGMEGHGDPFCRGPFPWGKENEELLSWHKRLINLRHEQDMLKTGAWIPLLARGDVYGYIRKITNGQDMFGQPKVNNTALIIVNRSTAITAIVELDIGQWCGERLVDILHDNRVIKVEQGRLMLTLEPLEGKLLLEEYHGS